MDKVLAFCASVKQREQQLKVSLKSLYEQNRIDEFHIVLNWYDEVPDWLASFRNQNYPRIHTYLNPTNKNAHDSIWFKISALREAYLSLDGSSFYCFTFDDDLLYPSNYVEKMIEAVDRYNKKAIITVHGSNIQRPVEDYFSCRFTYGFTDPSDRDIYVDMAGVGATAYHSSAFNPHIGNFPIPYCRDLWFAIAAKKAEIPIVTLQRPSRWLLPLQVEGDTVYDMSISNKKLRDLKNRILKEQFLPVLFLDKTCDKYVLMTDYDFDQRLTAKCLETLRSRSYCNMIMFTNELKKYETIYKGQHINPPIREHKILTQFVTPEELDIGRMGSKVITQYRFMQNLPNGSKIISADCDLYYCGSPFNAFGEFDFDIGLTGRPQTYHYPINAGVVMFRLNDAVKQFLMFAVNQVYERTWDKFKQYQNRFNHRGNDWYVDQDFWCTCWENREWINAMFGVNIVDIGHKYNFCPHADGNNTIVGKGLLMEAYEHGLATVLHLKSRLKELLYDGSLK